tara:strand:- start:543 stop:1259 length:717 start_codon:yes stop_codon:yes gene_type:complete
MANQKNIEDIALLISGKVEQLQGELVRDLLKLSKDKRFQSIDDFLIAIEQLNVEELLMIKADNITNAYISAHTQVLADSVLFGDVTENTLRSITQFSKSSFTDSLGTMGKVLKKEIIKGAISGSSDKDILKAIQSQAGLSPSGMQTLVTTGLNDYSRSVSKVQMDTMSKTQKYRYVGAIDDKTRPICVEMWDAGKLTQDEIESRFGSNVLVEGGGFNCRHQWLPVEAEEQSKDFRSAE